MTDLTWNRIGPREKQILAILRRAETSLPSRDVLDALRERDVDVAYTTVSTTLDRLAEKDLVDRSTEIHGGATRYRYASAVAPHRRQLVDGVVDDVSAVLGTAGLELLATRSQVAWAAARNRSRTSTQDTST